MSSSLYSRLADRDGPPAEVRCERYRAVSRVAVASLVLGVLSVLALAMVKEPALGLVPCAGMLLGYLAVRQIRRLPEELSGMWLAWAGIICSAGFLVVGCGLMLLVGAREFPYGYERIEYEMLQPDPDIPGERIPEQAYRRQYDQVRNNKVGIEGYMYPGRQTTRMKSFYLCPAIPNCPFCAPNPKPTEMIHVKLEGDLEARYTTNLIRVGGRFRVDETTPDGVPYRLDADYLVQPR
jgi:hypothetical protein